MWGSLAQEEGEGQFLVFIFLVSYLYFSFKVFSFLVYLVFFVITSPSLFFG